jgi:hypothetical protein
MMPTILTSPTKDDDNNNKEESISPLLSHAPSVLPPTTSQHATSSPTSPSDDTIPAEHKRIPGLIPRSPLSPLFFGRGLGLGIMAKRVGTRRKQVPPPIVIIHPATAAAERGGDEDERGDLKSSAVRSMVGSIVPSPSPVETKGGKQQRKRRTVWGMVVEGWWDLGLLGGGTVRRKK